MKILHLFHDLMNMHGDGGNVRYLAWTLEQYGKVNPAVLPVTVECQSIGDALSFEGYDLIYCGSGTEKKRDLALENLRPYREALREAIQVDKAVFLFTGNSWTMLGQSIQDEEGTRKALGIFDYETTESHGKRIVGDVIFTCLADGRNPGSKTVGFINKCGRVTGPLMPLFSVDAGIGNDGSTDKSGSGILGEGIEAGRFYGTYLTGPILVKNPPFLELIVKEMLGVPKTERLEDFTGIDPDAEEGYRITLRELGKRLNAEGPSGK